jgi:hypothetical protein
MCVCVCAASHGAVVMEHSVTCVTCLQSGTDRWYAVRQRGTGGVADTVFSTAADLLGASYDEPLKMELNSVYNSCSDLVISNFNALWSEPFMLQVPFRKK